MTAFKNKTILFLLVLLAVFVTLDCKKRPFDYRNKYKGDFVFTESYHYYIFNQPQPAPPKDTFISYQYDINISINYAKEYKHKLILKTASEFTYAIQVDKKGIIVLDCPDEGQGKFSNANNLTYTASYNIDCPGAGLGGGANQSTHTISATRK